MSGREVIKTITDQRSVNHCFVKWWRKENDFLDYDLIDRFMQNNSYGNEIGGLELLTMDDMWNEVKRIGGKRVNLLHADKGDRIKWVHNVKGSLRTDYGAYSPRALLAIFDVETEDNAIGT